MCDETVKEAVMTTIHEHIGFMDCDSLRKETGLASPDLFFCTGIVWQPSKNFHQYNGRPRKFERTFLKE